MSTVITFDPDGNEVDRRTVDDDPAQVNADALEARMDQALGGLRSYVAASNPTAAQTAAAVKLLCRVAIAVIRLWRRRLDGTD